MESFKYQPPCMEKEKRYRLKINRKPSPTKTKTKTNKQTRFPEDGFKQNFAQSSISTIETHN